MGCQENAEYIIAALAEGQMRVPSNRTKYRGKCRSKRREGRRAALAGC